MHTRSKPRTSAAPAMARTWSQQSGSAGPSPFRDRPFAPMDERRPMAITRIHRRLQAKLEVSQPDDPLEREADRVADAVMRMPEPAVGGEPLSAHSGHTLQRQAQQGPAGKSSPVRRHDELVTLYYYVARIRKYPNDSPDIKATFAQMKWDRRHRLLFNFLVQSKLLTISGPIARDWSKKKWGSTDQATAVLALLKHFKKDFVARWRTVHNVDNKTDDAVWNIITSKVPTGGKPDPGSATGSNVPKQDGISPGRREHGRDVREKRKQQKDAINQRKQMELDIQRHATGAMASDIDGSATQRIEALHGRGRPLDREPRMYMERRFGRRFEDVRVHTGAEADDAARAVHARAFTMGRDVVFAAGEYRPSTFHGRRLLAHELAHVVQQGGGVSDGSRRIRRTPEFSGSSGAESRHGEHVSRPKKLNNLNPYFVADLRVSYESMPSEIEAGFRFEGIRVLAPVIESRLVRGGFVYDSIARDPDASRLPLPLVVAWQGRRHTLRSRRSFVDFVTHAMRQRLATTADFRKSKTDPNWAVKYASAVVNLRRDGDVYRVTVRIVPPVHVIPPERLRLTSDNIAFCIDTSGSIGSADYASIRAIIADRLGRMDGRKPITVHEIRFDESTVTYRGHPPLLPRLMIRRLESVWNMTGRDSKDDTPGERVRDAVNRARTAGAKEVVVITDAPPATYRGVEGATIIQLDLEYRSEATRR